MNTEIFSIQFCMLVVLLVSFHCVLNRVYEDRDKLVEKFDALQDKYIALLESLGDDDDDEDDDENPDEPEPLPNLDWKEWSR